MPKDHPVYQALGALDELNSLLGLCRVQSCDRETASLLAEVQEALFVMQAEVAGAPKSITETMVATLEAAIARVEDDLPNPHAFVVPGSSKAEAFLDYARAVARRAEREMVTLHHVRPLSSPLRAYLNRLSSFLYALARHAAAAEGMHEPAPRYEVQ
jgi:cob(I)alamin adenosyltransferase